MDHLILCVVTPITIRFKRNCLSVILNIVALCVCVCVCACTFSGNEVLTLSACSNKTQNPGMIVLTKYKPFSEHVFFQNCLQNGTLD